MNNRVENAIHVAIDGLQGGDAREVAALLCRID
jgi:hypothetical protein